MSIEDNVRILRETPLIARLDADALRLIAFAGEEMAYRQGEEALQAGEPMAGALVVLSGSFAVHQPDGAAHRALVSGDILGEAALVVDIRASATLVAREPSQCMIVPRHLFRRVLTEYPANAQIMRAAFAARLKQMSGDLARIERRLRDLDAPAKRDGAEAADPTRPARSG